jgi:hypothetical protein
VSSGTAKSGDDDADLEDNGEGLEGVTVGGEESSGSDAWGFVTLTKRTLGPLGASQYASPSYAPAQPTSAREEPPAFFGVGVGLGAYDGREEYGGAATQFDGRVDDLYFLHDSDEPDGGEEQNECEVDEPYADGRDGGEGQSDSENAYAYADEPERSEERHECAYVSDDEVRNEYAQDAFGCSEGELDVLRL